MPPLHGSVGGRMVGGGEADLDVEGGHDVLVEVGDKRVAVVTDRQAGAAVPARPLEEGATAFGGGWLTDRKTFNPPRGPVKNRENITEPL